MLDVAAAASGVTLSHSAPGTPRDAAGVRRDMRRRNTGALACGGPPGQDDHWCQHAIARCVNSRGPHFAQPNVCQKKRTARGNAQG